MVPCVYFYNYFNGISIDIVSLIRIWLCFDLTVFIPVEHFIPFEPISNIDDADVQLDRKLKKREENPWNRISNWKYPQRSLSFSRNQFNWLYCRNRFSIINSGCWFERAAIRRLWGDGRLVSIALEWWCVDGEVTSCCEAATADGGIVFYCWHVDD